MGYIDMYVLYCPAMPAASPADPGWRQYYYLYESQRNSRLTDSAAFREMAVFIFLTLPKMAGLFCPNYHLF